MIDLLKKIARKGLVTAKKALAKNLDELNADSPYSRLMAGLEKKEDYEQYRQYTRFRTSFENKILQLHNISYVRMSGILYHLNRFKGNLSLREAFTDHTGLNSRMRFSLEIIKEYFSACKDLYLTEHQTPYHRQLSGTNPHSLVTSYYKPGAVLHQDMTSLTFRDNSFDLCLSFEDLEHIPDYNKAIAELYRVTRPGGHVLLSTPFILENEHTLIRATINENGEITHLLEPEYHGDPVLPQGILCYYHFGWDLLDSFRHAGFSSVKIITGYDTSKLILGTLLFIVAEK